MPLQVFTTRLETIFGVTFIAIAPDHPIVESFFIKEGILDSYAYEQYREKVSKNVKG